MEINFLFVFYVITKVAWEEMGQEELFVSIKFQIFINLKA